MIVKGGLKIINEGSLTFVGNGFKVGVQKGIQYLIISMIHTNKECGPFAKQFLNE